MGLYRSDSGTGLAGKLILQTFIQGDLAMNFLNGQYLKYLAAIKSDKGQTLVEYALLLLLIAIVVILMVKGVGFTTNNSFSKVNSALQ